MRSSRHLVLPLGLIGVSLLVGGCPPDEYPLDADPTLIEINRIRGNSDLTIAQRRQQLGDLGLTPDTINALLRDQRTGNQYGGDLRTAYNKVTGEQMSLLTPDEIQIYGDEASAVSSSDTLNLSLTDAEAFDISEFLIDNGLDSPDELEEFLDVPGNDGLVPASVTPEELRSLFVDFDSDQLIPRLP